MITVMERMVMGMLCAQPECQGQVAQATMAKTLTGRGR